MCGSWARTIHCCSSSARTTSIAPEAGTFYAGVVSTITLSGGRRPYAVTSSEPPAAAALHVDPCIPRSWPGYQITFRYHSARYLLSVANPHSVTRGVSKVTLDGAPCSTAFNRSATTGMVLRGRGVSSGSAGEGCGSTGRFGPA